MSVKENVVADVVGCLPKEVRCEKCECFKPLDFFDYGLCDAWKESVRESNYCTLFEPKGKKNG